MVLLVVAVGGLFAGSAVTLAYVWASVGYPTGPSRSGDPDRFEEWS